MRAADHAEKGGLPELWFNTAVVEDAFRVIKPLLQLWEAPWVV